MDQSEWVAKFKLVLNVGLRASTPDVLDNNTYDTAKIINYFFKFSPKHISTLFAYYDIYQEGTWKGYRMKCYILG